MKNKIREYEKEKARIRDSNLSCAEYEKAIRKIAKKLQV